MYVYIYMCVDVCVYLWPAVCVSMRSSLRVYVKHEFLTQDNRIVYVYVTPAEQSIQLLVWQ